MDFKGFKKISSDKDTTTLRHKDGHELRIAHSALSPKLRKGLDSIPHKDDPSESLDQRMHMYAKGDYVMNVDEESHPSTPEELSGATLTPTPAPTMDQAQLADIGIPKSGTDKIMPSGIPASEEVKHPEIFGEQPPQNTPAAKATVGALGDITKQVPEKAVQAEPQDGGGLSVLTGVPQEQNPLIKQLNAITQPNPALTFGLQQAYGDQASRDQQLESAFNSRKQELDAQHAAIMHDIANNHIDMGRYWQHADKGTAALGAFLGGVGAGLAGVPNPVPGMIADSQNNFLKAQIANQENDRSLLPAIQAQYGDNRDAADMLRIIHNEMLNNQVSRVMAPLASATAQANGAKLQLGLLEDTEQLKRQIAARQALADLGGSQQGPANQRDQKLDQVLGTVYQADPKTASTIAGHLAAAGGLSDSQMGYLDESTRKGMAKGPDGRNYNVGSEANAKQVNEAMTILKPAISHLKELQGLQSVGALIPGSPKNVRAESLLGVIQSDLLQLQKSGRISETSLEFLQKQLSDPRKFKTYLSGGAGTKELLQVLSGDLANTFKQYIPGNTGINFTPAQ